MAGELSTDAVMAELRGRVRERLRRQLAEQGSPSALQDPQVFAEVERILSASAAAGEATPLLLPELLGDPDGWRLRTAMHYQSHRGTVAGGLMVWLKRRLMMPVLRWLFEYSRDNFERQRRVNQVLFACVQELAAEVAVLRTEQRRADPRG